MIETFHFTQGVNRRKGRLYLDEGEMYDCDNFSMEHEGVLEARDAKTQSYAIDTETDSKINGLNRYGAAIYSSSKAWCPGDQAQFNYLYYRRTTDTSWTNIYTMSGNQRPRFANFEKFTFVVDGESKRALIGSYTYPWGFDAPTLAPSLTSASATGGLDGVYQIIYTYLFSFPDGQQYETAGSPAYSGNKYAGYTATIYVPVNPNSYSNLTIHRKLYRLISGTYYYFGIITDNTTTSYVDSDADDDNKVQTNPIYSNENYGSPPTYPVDVAVHQQRVWAIEGSTLYPSEAYQPFAFKTTTSMVVSKEDEDLVGIIPWADQLFIPTKTTWYRLQGSDADSWSIKRTYADHGCVNRDTIQQTRFGILSLDYDGIYLFNGSTGQNLTELKIGKDFITNLDDLSVCYSYYNGERYYFYYASSGTTVDSCLVIDFSFGPANLQMYFCDYIDAAFYYDEASVKYQALDGYEYTVGGTETIAISAVTGDRSFGNIGKLKNLRYLYYDIDTGGTDVTVTYYVDGTALSYTETLNTSSRERNRSALLPQVEGYRFSLGITCSDAQNVKIYSPWVLEGTPVGD